MLNMLINDIYDIILYESDMKNLLKLSLMNKYNQCVIEKFCKKMYLSNISHNKNIRFTSILLKYNTCYICHYFSVNTKEIIFIDGVNICYNCLHLPKCDECGEINPDKIYIRRRSTYCKDSELCEIRRKQIDENGFQNDILQNL
jgi:hypothetical protein